MAKLPSMHDTLREEGYWWRPEKPDDQVAGTLTFSQDSGAELALVGMLGKLQDSFRHEYDAKVIHGVTKKGKPVSLIGCILRSRQLNWPGIATERYLANLLIVGYHLSDQDDAIFTGAWIRFEGIEKWLEHKPYDFSVDDEGKQLHLVVNRTRLSEFATWGEHKIVVGTNVDTNQTETDHLVSVESMIGIRTIEVQSLRWFRKQTSRIMNLASLCTGRHLPQLMLRLEGPRRNIGPNINPLTEVDIYVQLISRMREKGRDEPILSGVELVANDPLAVARWFEEYEKLEPVMNLFFAVVGAQDMFLNVRFLLCMQALEVLHRTISSDLLIEEEVHQAFVEALKDAVPASTPKRMREKLDGMLRFSNEPSLNQRLKALMAEVTQAFGEQPAGFGKAFVRSLVDTRNYNTHHSPELKDKALEGGDLHWANRRMILLLTVLLLMRIGVPAGQLKTALMRHGEFSQLWNRLGRPH